MLKATVDNCTESILISRLIPVFRKLMQSVSALGSFPVLTEDSVYKRNFIHDFMPELYSQHTSALYMNCVFCVNLVRSKCHSNCLKCCHGTYIHCGSLFPGLLDFNTRHPDCMDRLILPWYYRETCCSFERLPPRNYFRNLYVAFSSNEICNFEVLEGLEKGLSSGERPCHICASVDYELYRKCSGQGDFDNSIPCHRINDELSSYYHKYSADCLI